jgi:hypothetical protein
MLFRVQSRQLVVFWDSDDLEIRQQGKEEPHGNQTPSRDYERSEDLNPKETNVATVKQAVASTKSPVALVPLIPPQR